MTGASWAELALAHVRRGERLALVTIAAAHGSAPREAGAKMLVTYADAFGTIGGGALEHVVIEQARRLLGQEKPRALAQDYPLGPLLAQCCGGHVRVLLQVLDQSCAAWLARAAACEAAGEPYVLRTILEGDAAHCDSQAGWPAGVAAPDIHLFDAAGAPVSQPRIGIAAKRAAWTRMIEHVRPCEGMVYLFGAGHVGQALAAILRTLPVRLRWFDTRPEAPGAEIHGDPARVAREAPPGALFIIMTHSHELDYALTQAVLTRGDALHVGLIGSRTKRARFLSRLAQDGVSAEARARLVCPIGAIGVRSKAPAAIAVAAAAEILLVLEASRARATSQLSEGAGV